MALLNRGLRVFRSFRARLIIGILVVTVVGILALIKLTNSPAQGGIAPPPAEPAPRQKALSPHTYKGHFITFTYPAAYSASSPSSQPTHYLESIQLVSTDASSKRISVSVVQESLQNDSGLNYRQLHPDLYRLQPGQKQGTIFSGINSNELTAYLPHNGMVASVSVNSTLMSDNVAADFKTVLDSFSWN